MAGIEDRVARIAGEIVAKAYRILAEYPLCNRCLGRMFALLGRGVSNEERGRAIKLLLVASLHSLLREGDDEAVEALRRIAGRVCGVSERLFTDIVGVKPGCEQCVLCGGRFEEFVESVSARIEAVLREYDADSFVVGVRLDDDVRRLESTLQAVYELRYAESIASELKREIGKRVMAKGYQVDFKNPDIAVLVEYPSGSLQVTVNPILVYGRYWKTARRVSQSSWITRFGVKRYPFSVEDGYAPLVELYGGVQVVIHAAGREDVDVRMLGSGRPIVVEVKQPKRRHLDLRLVEERLREMWSGLFDTRLESRVTRTFMRRVVKGVEGEERSSKIYRALVYAPEGYDVEDLRRLEEFYRNVRVRQRTPKRVRHRRADVIRERRVYAVRAKPVSTYTFEALIHAEGGLYIKELIAGEETWPGFPQVIGKPLYCAELDVLYVEEKPR